MSLLVRSSPWRQGEDGLGVSLASRYFEMSIYAVVKDLCRFWEVFFARCHSERRDAID